MDLLTYEVTGNTHPSSGNLWPSRAWGSPEPGTSGSPKPCFLFGLSYRISEFDIAMVYGFDFIFSKKSRIFEVEHDHPERPSLATLEIITTYYIATVSITISTTSIDGCLDDGALHLLFVNIVVFLGWQSVNIA
jgi:hypothetical protein